MIILDTNSLLRFFTNDIPKQAKATKDLIDSALEKTIPEVVFPELEYVLLGKNYNSSRSMVLKAFKLLTSHKTINVSKEMKKAVEIYEKTKLDMADCIIASYAFVHKGKLASFDKELITVDLIETHWQ